MARIEITTYKSFIPPSRLTEEEYNDLKFKYIQNPNFTLLDSIESITTEFNFNWFVYMFLGGGVSILLGLLLGDSLEWLTVILCVGGFFTLIILMFSFITTLPTLGSFSRYIKKKRNYYSRMEYTVKSSDSYQEFIKKFN